MAEFIGTLKSRQINLSIAEVDKPMVGILKQSQINLSTAQVDSQISGRYTVELVGGNTYYAMRGKDNTGYKTWVASGAPDTTASQYVGSISGTMTDIVVLQSWTS